MKIRKFIRHTPEVIAMRNKKILEYYFIKKFSMRYIGEMLKLSPSGVGWVIKQYNEEKD